MKAAEFTDPQAPVGKPGHHQTISRRVHRLQQRVSRAVGQHLRMPAVRSPRGQRIGRHRRRGVPEEGTAPVHPRRQPARIEPPAQLGVDTQRGLVQVEALQTGRRGRQRRPAVGALADSPRLAQRHPDLSAEDAHVALKVPQLHTVEAQALSLEPPKMIHEEVGVGPLSARSVVLAQEPVRRWVLCPFGPDDRPGPSPILPLDLLDPKVPDHHLPCHSSSVPTAGT